jgi:predicted metal-dependent hydrolase
VFIVRFLVRLVNRSEARPSQAKQLTRVAYEAVRRFGVDVGNLRVSSSAVELDLLLDSELTLQDSLKALESVIGPILTLRKLDTPTPSIEAPEAIRLGLDLFNQERYWESHEALESAWRGASGNEKEVLQGLILLAAALVHWQKNERNVTLSVMKRGCDRLQAHEGNYYGVDVVALAYKVNKLISIGQPDFFKIEVKP